MNRRFLEQAAPETVIFLRVFLRQPGFFSKESQGEGLVHERQIRVLLLHPVFGCGRTGRRSGLRGSPSGMYSVRTEIRPVCVEGFSVQCERAHSTPRGGGRVDAKGRRATRIRSTGKPDL